MVVVGNITVGGAGKTPFLMALCQALKAQNFPVGVVSRGFGRKTHGVLEVLINDSPKKIGDEPLLIKQRTHLPVFVGEKRLEAVEALFKKYPQTRLVLSDDGLQHYALPRCLELAVLDERGWGNGFLLPRGPLREPVSRLSSVDAVLLNGVPPNTPWLKDLPPNVPVFHFALKEEKFYSLNNPQHTQTAADFLKEKATWGALSGIGNPSRFFKSLENLGLPLSFQKVFSDHYAFKKTDFENLPADIIFISEKDAVKCAAFAQAFQNVWVLPVSVELSPEFLGWFMEKTRGL